MNSVLKQYETLSRTLFIKEFGQCFFMHSNNNSSMEISSAATFTNLKCQFYIFILESIVKTPDFMDNFYQSQVSILFSKV